MTVTTSDKNVGKSLGRIPGGLNIVSLAADGKEVGFLASWVQQAGFEPPMITIAFNKKREIHLELLKKSKNLVLNIMGKENSKTMSAFFKDPEEGQSVFNGLDIERKETNVPILKDCVAYLECKYVSEMESADHVIVLAEVVAGDMQQPDVEPSIHLRDNGFKY
jgi:flavin reductase (DIM6/NTAB) family NADH-FMN oxidoreductase RutF